LNYQLTTLHTHDNQFAVTNEVVPIVVFVMLAFSPDDDGGDEI
jgi:hypothetical protein